MTAVVLTVLAIYALFIRTPAGKLALENAYALRMYAAFYVTVPAVIAALIGYVLVARRWFWRDPALMLTVAFFCVFYFFKIRIVPEHFWAARRFLPVILPGTLLLACAAAFWGLQQKGWRRWVSAAIGGAFVLLLANRYKTAAQPVMHHVEYAGIIPELEKLASIIPDGELLLVESRDAGSMRTSRVAARLRLRAERARAEFGSTRPADVRDVSRMGARAIRVTCTFSAAAEPSCCRVTGARARFRASVFRFRRYESAWNAYPRSVRRKEFDFGLYELLPAASSREASFELDVGTRDDLHVVRFHAKEVADGQSMRWSQRQSFVAIPGIPPAAREMVIVMSSGGRPPAASGADVTVYLNERLLGTARTSPTGSGLTRFRFQPTLLLQTRRADAPARLRLDHTDLESA